MIKTMELRLERLWPKEAYTIGRLYINNEFFCNTLEDKIVDKNKNGKSWRKIWIKNKNFVNG